jgi:hypothetical protein
MFTSLHDVYRASRPCHEVLDELIPEVLLSTLKSCIYTKLQNRDAQTNLLYQGGQYQWIRYKSHAHTEGKLMARLTEFHRQHASHTRAYRVLNLETNQIMETCEVTFDETQPRNQLVFECAGDDELGEDMFHEEEHEHGDDEDGGMVPPAEPVPTTSTTVMDGPSPHLRRQTKIKEKLPLRGVASR